MHQDEPAVGVVLGGAGLAGHVGADAEAGADGRAGAAVDHAAHHVEQRVVGRGRQRAFGDGAELRQHLAVLVLDARDHGRRDVLPAVGDGAVGADHFLERHRAGAQRQRRHLFELALAHAHRAGQLRHAVRADRLHQLGGDRVLRIDQAVAQAHRAARGRRFVGGAPDLAAGSDLDRLVDQGVVGLCPREAAP
jgi:hypothetical protein